MKYSAVLVLPAHNEEDCLPSNLIQVYKVCEQIFPKPWKIIISENNSSDNTWTLAESLAQKFSNVSVLGSNVSGKGGAIRRAWCSTEADYYFFTDADLSADIEKGLPQLLASLQSGFDIATGVRGSRVNIKRPMYRRLISWGYRVLSKIIIGTKLKDLSCGLKGVNGRVVKELVPTVKDDEFFFDSELLLLAEKKNYKIDEIFIDWVEYRNKDRVRRLPLFRTSFVYLKKLFSLRRRLRRMVF